LKADFEGFLDKKGDKGFIGSRFWVKRYFRLYLNEGLLCYFADQKTFIQKGQINIGGILLVEKTTEKGASFNVPMKTSARVWRLSAKDDATRNSWIERLGSKVQGYQAPPKMATRPARKRKGQPPLYAVSSVQFMAEVEQCASTRHDVVTPDVPEHKPADGEVYLQLYGNHHAYIMEYRHLELDAEKKVWVHNLPKKIKDREDVITFKSLTDPKATVLQQQFYYDEKTPQRLLQKLIGKEIEVHSNREKHFHHEKKFSGIVMYEPHSNTYSLYNTKENTVHFLNTEEPISYNLLGNKNEELTLHGKTNIFHEPSVHLVIDSEQSTHLAEITYSLEQAFEWKATYNGVLNYKESELELGGWFDIKNNSGKTYEGAAIMVLADPTEKKKLTKEEEVQEKEAAEKAAEAAKAKIMPSLGGFGSMLGALGGGSDKPVEPPKPRIHKYYIQQRPTLKDDENKQIRFVTAKVPVTSLDLVRFDTPDYTPKPKIGQTDGADAGGRCETALEFYNDKASNLGMLLPAGKFNISRREKDTFGLNRVSHTSMSHYYPNDIVTVVVEPLEHVTATRKQLGFNLDRDKLFMVEQLEIVIVNSRLEPVDLVIQDSAYRWQTYEITESTPAYVKHPTHPRLLQWKVHLQAMEDLTINYTVSTRSSLSINIICNHIANCVYYFMS
jgi:hypothetical protein